MDLLCYSATVDLLAPEGLEARISHLALVRREGSRARGVGQSLQQWRCDLSLTGVTKCPSIWATFHPVAVDCKWPCSRSPPLMSVAHQPHADCRQTGQSFGRARVRYHSQEFMGRRPLPALPKFPPWLGSLSLAAREIPAMGGACMWGKPLTQPGQGLQM